MLVDWKDEKGRWFRMSVPDDASSDSWQYGTPIGPPDLTELGLPDELMVRLHNQLFERGLFTSRDATARRHDIIGAWQYALGADAQAVINAFGRLEQSIVIEAGPHPASISGSDQLVARAARRQRH